MNWPFATTVHHSMELVKLTSELTSSSSRLATTPRSGPDLGVRREGVGCRKPTGKRHSFHPQDRLDELCLSVGVREPVVAVTLGQLPLQREVLDGNIRIGA